MKQGVLFKIPKERPPAKHVNVQPFLEGLGFTHLATNKSGSFFQLRSSDRIRCHATGARMVITARRQICDYYVLLDTCDAEHVRQKIEIVIRQINSARQSQQLPPTPPAAREGLGQPPL